MRKIVQTVYSLIICPSHELFNRKDIKKTYYTSFAICVCSKSYFHIFILKLTFSDFADDLKNDLESPKKIL